MDASATQHIAKSGCGGGSCRFALALLQSALGVNGGTMFFLPSRKLQGPYPEANGVAGVQCFEFGQGQGDK